MEEYKVMIVPDASLASVSAMNVKGSIIIPESVELSIKATARAEALKDAGERAKKWMLDPEPGCSLLTAILAGEVKE